MFQVTEDTEIDEEAKEAFEVIFRRLNRGHSAEVEKALQEVLDREHRTLQQGFMRSVIFGALRTFKKAYDDNCYDLRNEASCKASAQILENTEVSFPFI